MVSRVTRPSLRNVDVDLWMTRRGTADLPVAMVGADYDYAMPSQVSVVERSNRGVSCRRET